jgi:hypothetical protein
VVVLEDLLELVPSDCMPLLRDESGGYFPHPNRSESELCGYGEEFLISTWMWIIRIRLCADAD